MPSDAISFADLNEKQYESQDYYQRLGLDRDEEDFENAVKKAYRARALLYHPDQHQQDGQAVKAEAIFKMLGEAYDTLSDPNKRLIYNSTLRSKEEDLERKREDVRQPTPEPQQEEEGRWYNEQEVQDEEKYEAQDEEDGAEEGSEHSAEEGSEYSYDSDNDDYRTERGRRHPTWRKRQADADRSYAAHQHFVYMAGVYNYKQLKLLFSLPQPLSECFLIPTCLPSEPIQDRYGNNIFDNLFQNPKLTQENIVDLLNVLSTASPSYLKYFYKICTVPLVYKIDPVVVFTYYEWILTNKLNGFTREEEIIIWRIVNNLKKLDFQMKIINAMLSTGLIQTPIDCIKFCINESQAAEEVMQFYSQCSPLIENNKSIAKLNSKFNEMAKLKILSLKTGEMKEIKEDKTENLENIESFLSAKRPSRFKFFTQKVDATSKIIFTKIKEKKLEEAKASIVKKQHKHEIAMQKQIDAVVRGYRR